MRVARRASSAGGAPAGPSDTSCRSARRRPAGRRARTRAHAVRHVLLGGAGQVRPSGRRSATRPGQRHARLDLRCEQLVLQVAVRDPGAVDERQRMRSASATVRPNGFSQAMPAESPASSLRRRRRFPRCSRARRWLGPVEPERVDGGIRNHVANRSVGFRLADVETTRARSAAAAACASVGLRCRARRRRERARKACRWNPALKPLPMRPTPRRLRSVLTRSPIESDLSAGPRAAARRSRAECDVADVTQIAHAAPCVV